MYPDYYEGPVILAAWVYLGHWQECEIIDADADTQTASIQPRGSHYQATVPFGAIQSVALKYAISGRILHNFGSPRLSNRESLAYIRGLA